MQKEEAPLMCSGSYIFPLAKAGQEKMYLENIIIKTACMAKKIYSFEILPAKNAQNSQENFEKYRKIWAKGGGSQ